MIKSSVIFTLSDYYECENSDGEITLRLKKFFSQVVYGKKKT